MDRSGWLFRMLLLLALVGLVTCRTGLFASKLLPGLDLGRQPLGILSGRRGFGLDLIAICPERCGLLLVPRGFAGNPAALIWILQIL